MNKNQINILYDNENNIKGFSFPYYGESFVCKKNESFMECFKRARYKMLKKYGIDIENHFNEENVRKQPIEVKKANPELRKRIAAGVVLVAMAGASAFGAHKSGLNISDIVPSFVSAQKQEATDMKGMTTAEKAQYIIKHEENKKLKEIYQKMIKEDQDGNKKYKNGNQLVVRLHDIDKLHDKINKIAINNPDANDKVAYIEAEELAAISDVYNSQNATRTFLENENEIRCNYLSGQASLVNLSQATRKYQKIDSLFKDKELKDEQINLQENTQKALDNYNMAPQEFIDMLDEIYKSRGSNPELQSEVAFGQPGVAAAMAQMSGKTLENYQYAAKTEGGSQFASLITDATKDSKRFAEEQGQIDLKKQDLINQALTAMDERIKDYDRTDFDASTTEKGQEMVKEIVGDLGITANGDYVIRKTTKTTTTTTKISRAKAVEIFGEKKVQEVEKKVIEQLDKKTEQSKNQNLKNSKTYTDGLEAGQQAFVNGGPSTTSEGNSDYQRGYKVGYQHAKDVFEEQSKKDNKKEETFVPEPSTDNKEPTESTTTPSTDNTTPTEPDLTPEEPPVIEEWVPETTKSTTPTTTREKVKSVESEGTLYEPEEPTSKTNARTRA